MEPGLHAKRVPVARVAGAGAIVLGVTVLAGWAFEITALKSIAPAMATMKANTALAFILSGAALVAPRGAVLFGLAAALLAAMTLAQDLLGFNLGIDQALVRDHGAEPDAAPGRMSAATAFCFMLAGIAAALIAKPGREEAGQWLALALLATAIVALVGYAYDGRDLYKVWPYASMAAHTALGLLVLAMGLLAARRDQGWMRRLGGAGPGGRMLRQVLLPALIGLFALGGLRVLAGEGGLFDVGFGTALMVISAGLLFTWLAWRFARELDRAAQVLEQMAARRRRHEALIEGQRRCLELVATGAPLAQTHEELARTVEAQVPGMLCSILLLDSGGRVRHSAAPSMPPSFVRAIDGRMIGPAAGSCGTAAYRRQAVVVDDIASDPLWADYREYALPHGLRACWSTPVFDDEGQVVATFALYYRDPRRPEPEHVELIRLATQTVAISVQRHRAEATLRESESRLRHAMRASNIGLWDWDMQSGRVNYSREWKGLLGYEEKEIGESFDEWESRVEPSDRARVFEQLRRYLAQPAGAFETEFRMRGKNGVWRWIYARGEVVRGDAGGDARRMLGCHIDITERKAGEDKVRSLARRLLQVEEYERRALSRELHDRVGQNLSAINLNLQLIREKLARGLSERAAARIEDTQRLLSETTRDVRDLMVELRPPGLDDYGLATALRNYVERTADRFSGEISVTGDLQPRLPVDTELALFRIAQEALSNAAKHSRADNVGIQLERADGRARMIVVDDGVGFAPDRLENASWGLATMRERAEAVSARLLIESRPGAGARITAELAA